MMGLNLPREGLLPVPIDAEVLAHIGQLPETPAPVGFDPTASWRGQWSIHSIHGYADRGIGDAGSITITRRPTDDGVQLQVDQQIGLLDGVSHRWQATCSVENGSLPCVKNYSCEFESIHNGEMVADLSGRSEGRVEAGEWIHRQGRFETRTSVTCPISSDWVLLAEGASVLQNSGPFTVLDNLSVRKTGQHIALRDDLAQTLPDGTPMRCWIRYGQATLPVETFVTDDGRVPLVTAANKWWALEMLEVI